MLRDLGWSKKVKLQNAGGTVINPATIEKLEELKTALQAIYGAVDGLELITGNISIDAAQINLNTDDLETKVQSVRDQLDVLLSTRASESTLADVKTVLDNIKTVIDSIDGTLDVNLSTVATEISLIAVKDAVIDVETKLQTIIDTLDVNLSTRASEATQTEIKETIGQESGVTVLSRLQDIRTQLDVALSTRASEATVTSILGKLNLTLSDLLAGIKGSGNKDFTTLEADIEAILLKLDTDLSTLASEATLIEVRDYLDTVETKLQTIISKNQAQETGGNLDNIKTNTDKLNVNLSTRASESTVSSINTKTGEVQASPTQYTILGRLKDLWDKLHDLFVIGVGKLRLWDGTNQASVDSEGHILAAGKAATGAAPSANPVSVSGVDTGGIKRAILTDTIGQIYTVPRQVAGNIPIQIKFQAALSAINSNEWQEVLNWTVPANYEFNASTFDGFSQSANESIRAISEIEAGEFDCPTNTFTDGLSMSAPQFASGMYIHVTTAIGSGINDLITITYTNQDGVGGRTANVTIPKSSLVGTRIEIVLQAGDFGIRDVTNVTHSATGQAGEFDIEIFYGLFFLIMAGSNVHYQAISVTSGAAIVPAGGVITLQVFASTKTSYIRRINLNGILIPR